MRQSNFSGGEIGPRAQSRTDRSYYARGLRTMRNFFADKETGAAVSRAGSLYIQEARDSAARLVPFVYSDSDSFCIEVGRFISPSGGNHMYFRFFTDGGPVRTEYLEITQTVPFVVGETVTGGTSAATAEIIAINISETAGQVRLQVRPIAFAFQAGEPIGGSTAGVGVAQGPAAIDSFEVHTVTVGTDFNLERLRFAQIGNVVIITHPDFPPQRLERKENVGGRPHWTFGNVVYEPALPFFDPGSAAGGYPVIDDTSVGSPDAQHPLVEWAYICTLTVQDIETGRTFETYGWRIREAWDTNLGTPPYLFSPDMLPIYPDMTLRILRGGHIEADGSSIPYTAPAYGINFPNYSYRVIAMNVYRGRANLFGWIGRTTTGEFIDQGQEPNYTLQPPYGTNPFIIRDASDAFVELEHPAAVCFHGDRLVFAGTPKRPADLWFSAVGEYTNFDMRDVVHVAGEALNFQLAARKFQEAIHVVSHERLIVGTRSAVWVVGGAQGDAAIDFDSVDAVQALEIGMTELVPLIIDDVVMFARAKGSGVRMMQFDGRYGRYGGVDCSKQANHIFLGKAVSEVGIKTSKSIIDWTYAEDPWGIVWAVRADGTLLSFVMRSTEEYGWARHDGGPTTRSEALTYGTPAVYKRVCAVPEGDEDYVYVIVKRPLARGVVTCVERMFSRLNRGETTDMLALDSALVYQDAVSQIIGDFDHLEGEVVYVVGKGNPVRGPFTVTGGQVDLGELPTANEVGDNVTLAVGLRYTCDLQSLPAVSAETRAKNKAVTRALWEVDDARGITVGQGGFTDMVDSRPDTVENNYTDGEPQQALLEVVPSRGWDKEAVVTLRQEQPIPVTVTGLVREFEVGG